MSSETGTSARVRLWAKLLAVALAGLASLVIHMVFLCVGTVVVVYILRAMGVIA
jgi:hypothetical protein